MFKYKILQSKLVLQNRSKMAQSKKVGQYHILMGKILGKPISSIGSGSFANTYQAYKDKNKQKIYACKVLNKVNISTQFQNTDYIINRIREQFKVLQSLHHLNIVGFEDSQQTKQNIYLFLQYCPNGTLKNYIETHRFAHNQDQEMSFIKQIIEGCFYLEEKGIVHRDIKPENILLSKEIIKIADFGLAKQLDQQDSYKGTVAGTIHYMAPQILKESKAKQTKKCDVWSVGITIYELVTGYLPFQISVKFESPKRILDHLQKKQQQDWQQIKDPLIRTLIFKMLVFEPSKRITFKQALQIISYFNDQ